MSHSSKRFSRSTILVGIFGTLVSLCGEPVLAQSSVVQLPDSSRSFAGSRVTRMVSNQLPNDLPEALLQTERALTRPMPSGWGIEMSFERLMAQMKKAGFRFKLDESAIDNNLDEEASVVMQLPGRSIDENFRFLLRDYGCGYRITEEGTLQVMSEDAILGTLDRVTFSVGNLATSYQQGEGLMSHLEETIDPDSWESNGGNARMVVLKTKRGLLLTVTQTYFNQVKLRQQLVSMMRLGGGVASPNYIVGSPSRSVQLPITDAGIQGNWAGGSSFRGGRGVGGLGGGVF